jgi:hypothetical protein
VVTHEHESELLVLLPGEIVRTPQFAITFDAAMPASCTLPLPSCETRLPFAPLRPAVVVINCSEELPPDEPRSAEPSGISSSLPENMLSAEISQPLPTSSVQLKPNPPGWVDIVLTTDTRSPLVDPIVYVEMPPGFVGLTYGDEPVKLMTEPVFELVDARAGM